jgi:hypothetical protein
MMPWAPLGIILSILAGLIMCCAPGCASHREATVKSAEAKLIVPEAGNSPDFRTITGSEAVIPISVEAGEPVIEVNLNGLGPFPMIFDTGAQDALTPVAVGDLGLHSIGSGTGRTSSGNEAAIAFTQVNTVRLDNAEMTDQSFKVIALPLYLTDRGRRIPLAGFIGYELLARFVIRLDYDSKTMTLKPATGFHYEGNGVRMPLFFTDNTPAVRATVDGSPGRFAIDTGSQGALTLRREFVERHRLEARHPRGLQIKSGAADGPYEAIITRLDRFDIAESRIGRPAARFPSSKDAGWPAFADVDGSIGYEILRQFIVTFDYSHGVLWLEHSKAFGTKSIQGTTGFQAMKLDSSGFRVITVLPNTPATSAGVMVGDLIIEVDRLPAGLMSQAEFGELLQRSDGTVVQFRVVRDGSARLITLTLQELLP